MTHDSSGAVRDPEWEELRSLQREEFERTYKRPVILCTLAGDIIPNPHGYTAEDLILNPGLLESLSGEEV